MTLDESASLSPEQLRVAVAELEQLRLQVKQASEIAQLEMRECGCQEGSFIYGCQHSVRRLRAILTPQPNAAALSSQ